VTVGIPRRGFGDGRQAGRGPRVVSVEGEEWRQSRGVRGVVVCGELRQGEPRAPVILQVIDVRPEVLLHDGVESLCLAVGLRVEGGGHATSNLESAAQPTPEVGGELGATVGGDCLWQAVQAEDPLEEQVGEVGGVHVGAARDEVALLGQAVDNYPNGVATLRPGEADDKVHADILPGCLGYGERSEEAEGGVSGGPRAAAGVAVAHETVHVSSHGVPVVPALEELEGLSAARVTEGGGVVECSHEVEPEVIGGGDVEAVAVVKEARAVLALGQGDLWVALVAALECLQHLVWGFVSLVCLLEQAWEGITPIAGRVARQQTHLLTRLWFHGCHSGLDVVRLEDGGEVLKVRVPLIRTISGSSSQSVGLSTLLAWSVRDPKVETTEELGPPGLTTVKQLRSHKVLQVLMV
jgi:hypothetical protein